MLLSFLIHIVLGLPSWLGGKEFTYQSRRHKRCGSNLLSQEAPGVENGSPLQHSCLENPMDRGAWWATVHGVTESDTTEHAYMFTHIHKRLRFCHSFRSNLDLYSLYKWYYLVVLSSSWHESRHISQNF